MRYEWKCEVCDFRVTVERKLDDRDIAPKREEYAHMGQLMCVHPDWIRVIGVAPVMWEHARDAGVFERHPDDWTRSKM